MSSAKDWESRKLGASEEFAQAVSPEEDSTLDAALKDEQGTGFDEKRDIKNLYHKFRDGDHLTTSELEYIVDYMGKLEKLLTPLGPEFKIAAIYLLHMVIAAEEYLYHRRSR